MSSASHERIAGWGRTNAETVPVARPDGPDEVVRSIEAMSDGPVIARGLGRSYGDAAQAPGGVVLTERLNRMIHFDPATGELTLESGVALGAIIDTFLPQGWMPAVLPGTRWVSVGGAVAADIHGKNHHRDGSFGDHLLALDLLLPSGERRLISREQDAALFAATVGGMGLTGIILGATIRLTRAETPYIATTQQRTGDLEETLRVLRERDDKHRYSVAWIDTIASGRHRGRAVCMWGDPLKSGDLTPNQRRPGDDRLPAPRVGVPIDAPNALLGPLSVRLFNELYYRSHGSASARPAHVAPFFFPLDAVSDWNRLYGRRGFYQHQTVLPDDERGLDALRELLETMRRAAVPGFLAVLKRFGQAGSGMLSFPQPGWTLAVDLPATPAARAVAGVLDRITLDAGGRIYLAKDALMAPESVTAMYPRLAEFQALRAEIDPQGRIASRQALRLGLAKGVQR